MQVRPDEHISQKGTHFLYKPIYYPHHSSRIHLRLSRRSVLIKEQCRSGLYCRPSGVYYCVHLQGKGPRFGCHHCLYLQGQGRSFGCHYFALKIKTDRLSETHYSVTRTHVVMVWCLLKHRRQFIFNMLSLVNRKQQT